MLPGRHRPMVSAISLITVSGVALGVFSLIVVLAILRGSYAQMVKELASLSPHITIVRNWRHSKSPFTTATLETVRSAPGVKAAMPWMMRTALFRAPGNKTRGKVLRVVGFDLREGPKVLPGLCRLSGGVVPGPGQILLNRNAYKLLGVTSGSRLLASFYPESLGPESLGAPVVHSLQVAGSFHTMGREHLAFMNLDDLCTVLRADEDGFYMVEAAVDVPESVDTVRLSLQERLGPGARILTWRDENLAFGDVLGITIRTMFVILFLLVVIAALNIVGTLVMVVMEKTREIGSLKAMGANQRQIGRIFLLHGLAVGCAGAVAGAVLGLFACYLLQNHVSLSFLAKLVRMERFPILVEPWWTALIVVSAVLIAVAAASYPAWKAARLDAAEALRYE